MGSVLGWLGIAIGHCAVFARLWYVPESPSTPSPTHAMSVTFVVEQTPVAVQQPQPVQPIQLEPPKPKPKIMEAKPTQ